MVGAAEPRGIRSNRVAAKASRATAIAKAAVMGLACAVATHQSDRHCGN